MNISAQPNNHAMKTREEGHFISHSPEETQRIAASLALELPTRAVIALHGDLGAGKTCFVKGLAGALGIQQAITSPTFTIVNEYRGERRLCHIDLYRLGGPDELLALGFDEYLERDGVTAVEWAERGEDVIPPSSLHVYMANTEHPEERTIRIVWNSP